MPNTPQQIRASESADRVRLGLAIVNEARCIAELAELRRAIESWAKENLLWDGSALVTPFIHKRDAPERYDALLLSLEGSLHEIFHFHHQDSNKHYEHFKSVLNQHGFDFEMEDATTICISPLDENRADEYLAFYRWQWIQNLATRRLYDIHEEVFAHFAKHPDHLIRLEWRQYEEFLDTVFRNQGFRTELGPGTSDGGVDIRLYQSQSIPQMVTIVQAKRYATKPIGLETVAALFGIAVQQRVHKGILATTSRFLPGAKQFSQSVSSDLGFPNIELVDSHRVGGWCADIAEELNRFFQNGETPAPSIIGSECLEGLTGRIVVACGVYNMVSNYFAKIVADFPHEVILQRIDSEQISGDGQSGTEVAKDTGEPHPRFIAFKRPSTNGELNFWGNGELYSLWNGKPQYFDHAD
jgi:Restriction endonuclease